MNASWNQVSKRVYVSDFETALCRRFIERHNIIAIINCTPDIPEKFRHLNVRYLRLPLDDSGKNKDMNLMSRYIPVAMRFIHSVLKNNQHGNILIHCHAGIQRSATIFAAYLMRFHNIPLRKAVSYIKKRRPVAFYGNINFLEPLTRYERTLDERT